MNFQWRVFWGCVESQPSIQIHHVEIHIPKKSVANVVDHCSLLKRPCESIISRKEDRTRCRLKNDIPFTQIPQELPSKSIISDYPSHRIHGNNMDHDFTKKLKIHDAAPRVAFA